MFKTYPNHLDVNALLNTFKDSFNFTEFQEENKTDRLSVVYKTVYKAITQAGQRDLEVTFITPFITTLTLKHRVCKLSFIDTESIKFVPNKIKDDRQNIIHMMEKMYQPDFDKVTNLIDVFISEGEKTSVINVVDKKYYAKSMEAHINKNHYDTRINMIDQNVADVYFNNILQRGDGVGSKHFKKSYINVDIIYLVHSDNTIHPYFKVRLPYFESKKLSCVMPLGASDKAYFYLNDVEINNQYIDQRESFTLNEEDLRLYFKDVYENQIKNTISSKLKISKTVLKGLSIDELKDYFVLVEMVNI